MFSPVILLQRHSRQLSVIASLVFATMVCFGLLGLRMIRSHNSQYSWMVWNLFLAWLPAGCALLAYNLRKTHSRLSGLVVFGCAVTWFFFFPNAPYLLTDLIHLRARPGIPFWYDLLLLLAFAWTGFFLGLWSLLLMQEVVRRLVGTTASWVFALVMLVLGSFGIYLGRFQRWNSWDVLSNPQSLFLAAARPLRHPFAHVETVAFSVLFAFFMMAMYLTLRAVMGFHHEVRRS